MMRASFAQAPATIAGSTTFADAGWPPENALLFGRPFLRTYSPNTSAQRLTLDLATATSLAVVWLCNVNFTTCTIQGHATDAWGSPSYTSGALTIGQAGTGRYHHALRPVAFNYRYLSLSIPSQAPTDGASVFKVGQFLPWPTLVSPPRDILMAPDEDNREAFVDPTTEDGRRMPRLVLDDPAWQVDARRLAETEAELAAWRAFDFQWADAPGQAALVLFRDNYPNESYLMRKTTSKWRHERVWMASDLSMFEVTQG